MLRDVVGCRVSTRLIHPCREVVESPAHPLHHLHDGALERQQRSAVVARFSLTFAGPLVLGMVGALLRGRCKKMGALLRLGEEGGRFGALPQSVPYGRKCPLSRPAPRSSWRTASSETEVRTSSVEDISGLVRMIKKLAK